MTNLFVQIGGSRDGRDPYLSAARRRSLHAVLIETPEYMVLRGVRTAADFDSYVALAAPADVGAVLAQISRLDGAPRLVLAGFERYARCAHAVAARVGLTLNQPPFRVPSKIEQRTLLGRNAAHIGQPRYWLAKQNLDQDLLREIRYPAVLKPVNGGGGLCVYLVEDPDQLNRAFNHGRKLRNYDNSAFPGWLVEEYVDGIEFSVQGLERHGVCTVLSLCTKVIVQEPVAGLAGILSFREAAHIAVGAQEIPLSVLQFAQDTVHAMGYCDGPFHIDFRLGTDGPVFIEMGFRLSGAGVTDLVREVSGCDWGEETFSLMIGDGADPLHAASARCAANVLAFSEWQIEEAKRFREHLEIGIERLASPTAELTSIQEESLSADLIRHLGPLARIHITGEDRSNVARVATELATLNQMKGV